jgi:lipopolysaccharide/colanic/teichoic acid biosynthesis glycosyltransferase
MRICCGGMSHRIAAPIFLATAIAIKLNSRGPIFVREPQPGSSNRVIEVFKFRSVTSCAERSIWPRPTWIAQVLGDTGLSQLPHLFNVLRGEMSLIDLLRAIGRDGVLLP